ARHNESIRGTATRSVNRMQVDIVQHLIVRVAGHRQSDGIILAHPEHWPRYLAIPGHVHKSGATIQLALDFTRRKFDLVMDGMVTRYGRGNIRGISRHTFRPWPILRFGFLLRRLVFRCRSGQFAPGQQNGTGPVPHTAHETAATLVYRSKTCKPHAIPLIAQTWLPVFYALSVTVLAAAFMAPYSH